MDKKRTREKRDTLLILASGRVNQNLYADLGSILTSDIPVANTLLIQILLENVYNRYSKIFITLAQTKTELASFLVNKFPNTVVYFAQPEDEIGVVIRDVLASAENPINQLDILYGDTVQSSILESDDDSDLIMATKNTESLNWDKVGRSKNGELVFHKRGDDSGEKTTITGGFRITNPQLFHSVLNNAVNNYSGSKSSSTTFYQSLKTYEIENTRDFKIQDDRSWQDSGHIDTYYELRRELLSKAFRSFNSVKLSDRNQWVEKSGHQRKIEAEYKWFEGVPKEFSHYLPRVHQDASSDSYSTEFLTSLPVSDMWLSENNDDAYWLGFVDTLNVLLDDFKSVKSEEQVEEVQNSKSSIYLTKFESRIEKLGQLFESEGLSLDHVKLQRITTPNTKEIFDNVLNVGKRISKLPYWALMHGDMCFSNLLYERRSKGIKLIDPRGSFGAEGIYGDPLYEILKISQCALGDYDFIAANLYSISISGHEYTLSHLSYPSHRWQKEIFTEILEKRANELGVSLKELRILESGLFFSAAALHKENSRFIALTLKGIEIYLEAESN